MGKIKITEKQYQQLIEEGLGDTLKGVRGYLGGTGYSYTKYSNEIVSILIDVNKKINKYYKRIEDIVEESRESNMSDNAFVQIDNNTSDAIETYKMMYETNEIAIYNLKESLSSDREFIKDMGYKPKIEK